MKTVKTNAIKTVLIISIGFGIVFFLFDVRWSLYTSLIVGVLGIISSKVSQGIDYLWMKVAKVLSFIVPNILLSIVFYLFLFPLAIMSKVFGSKNTFQLKNKNETLWVNKNTQIEEVSFEKMW